MPCYKPIIAWQSKALNPKSGKSFMQFRPPNSPNTHEQIQVECGKCIGCRLERSRQFAIRGMHEAQMHTQNSFITLTYNDDHIDPEGNLVRRDFQNFMKRLRKSQPKKKIRFLQCGEYGTKTGRPHYHAILFGHDFSDKKHVATRNGNVVYSSKQLQKLWSNPDKGSPLYGQPIGLTEVGSVTFESIAYIARYCCKKFDDHNVWINKDKYQEDGRLKEYNTMSNRPGLGYSWYQKFGASDVFNTGTVKIRGGIECAPPKYYMKKLSIENPLLHDIFKKEQREKAKNSPDNTHERLKIRESIKYQQFEKLNRSL